MPVSVESWLGLAVAVMVAAGCSPGVAPGNGAVQNAAAAKQVTVKITGFQFQPETVAVSKGGTVIPANADSVPHTATPSPPGSFTATGLLAGGDRSAPITLSQTGTFGYACNFHPSMKGWITVVP